MIDQYCSFTRLARMQKTGRASHKRGYLITTTITTGAKEAKEAKEEKEAKGAGEARVGDSTHTGTASGRNAGTSNPMR